MDGDTNPNRYEGHCAYASSSGPGVWWKVDLRGLYTIDRVIVFNNNNYGTAINDKINENRQMVFVEVRTVGVTVLTQSVELRSLGV